MMNIGKIITHGFKPSPATTFDQEPFKIHIDLLNGENVASWYEARKVVEVSNQSDFEICKNSEIVNFLTRDLENYI